MDRKFYSDSFERLLKEHADDFKMYPSERAWHGIYNNLHPGRKWPSLAMGIMLIGSLLLVGRLNTSTVLPVPNALDQQLLSSATTSVNKTAPLIAHITSKKNMQAEDLSALDISKTIDYPAAIQPTQISNSTNNGYPMEFNEPDLALIQIEGAPSNSRELENLNPIVNGIETGSELSFNPGNKLPGDVSSAKIKAADIMDSLRMADLLLLANSPSKKQRGISYRFYGRPSIAFRNFVPSDLAPAPAVFSSPAFASPLPPENTVDHRMTVGYEIGADLLYDLSKRTRLRVGAQFNYTGYKIHAYSVHPTSTNLILVNEFGQQNFVNSISSYSTVPGSKAVNLHNQQLQLSLPVGIEYAFAQAGKFNLVAAASFQPTYMITGKAYLSSADNKHYIASPSLLRSWNMNGSFETFVSFKTTSNTTFNIGPKFRYQFLSTYTDKYPHREHLLDLGLKFGITRSLR